MEVEERLVRALLGAQCPDLASLPIRPIEAGWDNFLFRLGDDLVVRLPRRATAAALVEREHAWLPTLAPGLPLPAPVPVRRGVAGEGFPWAWSVLPWLPGRTADLDPPDDSESIRLADFLRALHQPAPEDAPDNPYRGVPLVDRADGVGARLDRLREHLGPLESPIRAAWRRALDAPRAPRALWIHGDLHPLNVLTREGTLAGVIDWGDLAAGDPATDLASIWMLFDDPAVRSRCLDAYGAGADLAARGMGWAVFFGTAILDNGLADDPRKVTIGRTTLRRVARDSEDAGGSPGPVAEEPRPRGS